MAARYDRVSIDWTADFRGTGTFKVALTPEDQDAPELLAFMVWLHEVDRRNAQREAEAALARGDQGSLFFL